VFGDVAGGVALDEEVEVAGILVRGYGGVGADDFFLGLGEFSGDRYVLADGEAEDVRWAGEGKAVSKVIGVKLEMCE
jgi:hypothetical protein